MASDLVERQCIQYLRVKCTILVFEPCRLCSVRFYHVSRRQWHCSDPELRLCIIIACQQVPLKRESIVAYCPLVCWSISGLKMYTPEMTPRRIGV